MKTRVLGFLLFYSVLARSLAAASSVAATPPVGMFKITAMAGADTFLSIPLETRSVATARVSAVESDRLVLEFISNGDQFSPSALGTFYLQFVTGRLAGVTYRITSQAANVFHLDTGGDDLSRHPLGEILAGQSGDVVRIRRFWSISDVFGTTTPVLDAVPEVRPGAYLGGDAILLYDNQTVGFSKSPLQTVVFLTSAGWRRTGDAQTDAGSVLLEPGQGFAVRRSGATAAKIGVVGYVHTGPFVLPIAPNSAAEINDALVSVLSAAPLALSDAGLLASDATKNVFQNSPSAVNRGDVLLDFGDNRSGFARPPRYQYYTLNEHWFEGDANADQSALSAGAAYILRFRGSHTKRFWVQPIAQ